MAKKRSTRSRARKRPATLPVSYKQIDGEEPIVGNPIDIAVHRRVGRGPLMRQLVRTSQAAGQAVEKLAERLVREALATDLPREERAAAAVLAAWAVLATQAATPSARWPG